MAYKFSVGTAVFGTGDTSWDGILSSSGIATIHGVTANRLNSQVISSSLAATHYSGAFDHLAAGVIDVGGGEIDGTVIGGNTAAAATFTTISASTSIDAGLQIVLDAGGTGKIGVTGDLDLMTLTANTLTVAGAAYATTVSSSTTIGGLDLVLDPGGTGRIGVTGDLDLMTLTANNVAVAGVVSGSSTATLAGLTTYGIVGSSIEGTDLSSSNTLVAVGNSQFGAETGPGAYATISSAGAIAGTSLSSSGDATLASGLFVSGNLASHGVHIYRGLRVGPTSGGDTTSGVISGSAAATLYGLVTHEVDAVSYRGSGALLQGLTASAGPSTSTNIFKRGDLETVLSGGMNYFTASTNPVTVLLPTASYGDIVYVKASSGVSAVNFIKLTMSIAKSGELGNIDGAAFQSIETPYGSISLCYVEDSTWRIF